MKIKFVSKPIPFKCDLIFPNYVEGGDGVFRFDEFVTGDRGFSFYWLREYAQSIFKFEVSRNAFQKHFKDEMFVKEANDTTKYLPDIFTYDVETRILKIEYNGRESFFDEGYKRNIDFTTKEQFYVQLNEFASKKNGFEWDTRIFIDDRGKDFTKTKLYKENNGGCFGIFILLPISIIIYHLFTI